MRSGGATRRSVVDDWWADPFGVADGQFLFNFHLGDTTRTTFSGKRNSWVV